MNVIKTKEEFLNYLSKELDQIIELVKKLTIEDLTELNSSNFHFQFQELKMDIKCYRNEKSEIIKNQLQKEYFEGFFYFKFN